MNKKTILLSTLIAVATGQAIASSEYRMRIGIKEISSDANDGLWTSTSVKGDILDVGNPHSCDEWTPDPSSVFVGKNFLQSRNCQQDKSQDETITQTHSVTGEKKEEVKTNTWSDSITQQNNATGSKLYSSCKEAKDNEPGASSGTYNLQFGSFYCDMTTDGGGWTKIGNARAVSQANGSTASQPLNDQGLSYSEVFINDKGSVSDYAVPMSNGIWDFNGFDIGKIAIKVSSNKWYNAQGSFPHASCNKVPNKLPRSNYKIIESSSVCLDSTSKVNDCGTKVSIQLPAGERITAVGDTESVYGACYSDNYLNYNYDFYVR